MNARDSELIYLGDITAPKGTYAHTVAVHEQAKVALNDAAFSREEVETWVGALRDSDCFRSLKDSHGVPFLLWEVFCTTPQPHGLGYDPAAIEAIVSERARSSRQQVQAAAANTPDAEEQNTHGGDRKSSAKLALDPHAERAEKNGVSHYTQRKLDRLRRDFPDLHQQVASGELSAHRASVLAGIVKDPTPADLLCKAWRKASPAEREWFLTWIKQP